MKKIHINQLGYRPNESKKAVIANEYTEFSVIRLSDKAVIFNGKAGEAVTDAASNDTVRIADFSSVTEIGEYEIRAGNESSFPFKICDAPYKELRKAVLEMFNYQKCGIDLNAGPWSHPACHASIAAIYGTDEKKDVTGGWHDAGDYGRYIVPAAKSVADLLLGYEISSEKDNNLLEIVWFEIEWMLKMQDERTGGVHHKASCRKFNPLHEMPHDEKGEIVVTPVSSTATADFAAAIALASRFYPDKKDALLKAAKKAWDWLTANPDLVFENPKDIHTGSYGDDCDKDERFWAACELFAAAQNTSEEEKYHDYIKKEIHSDYKYPQNPWFKSNRRLLSGLGWGNMGTYGIIAYLSCAKENKNEDVEKKVKDELFADCEEIMEKFLKCPYGISLGMFFPWGSNMIVANNAMALIYGSRFTDNTILKTHYTEAAYEHFHYLLGRNPLSQSYISGFGSNPMKNPHHRPSASLGRAVPGMVAGGPLGHFDRDPAINEHCKDAPPAKRYIDDEQSFSSNEITIYWNSPVYFLMAALNM